MLDTITHAIKHRRLLEIEYPPGRRIIEPHCLGYSQDGNLLLRAYQVGGASSSGEPQHWKLFRLDRLLEGNGSEEIFIGPRPGYNPDDKAMKGGIIARL